MGFSDYLLKDGYDGLSLDDACECASEILHCLEEENKNCKYKTKRTKNKKLN